MRHDKMDFGSRKAFMLFFAMLLVSGCSGNNQGNGNSPEETAESPGDTPEARDAADAGEQHDSVELSELSDSGEIVPENIDGDAGDAPGDSSMYEESEKTPEQWEAYDSIHSDSRDSEAENETRAEAESNAQCGNGLTEGNEKCDGQVQDCTTKDGKPGVRACSPYCNEFFACVSRELPPSGSPYPRSPILSGISFDRSSWVKAAGGSDQFGQTIASNNNVYLAWGDGGGFGGSNSQGRVSLGVARIEGVPPNWKAHNVWGGVNHESSQQTIQGKANGGIVAIGGILYLNVAEQGVWTNSRLWKSTNFGLTWVQVGRLFNEPNGAFAGCGILQFGPGNEGARDSYIYGYDTSAFKNGLAMFRVAARDIETRSKYEFFTGLDINGNPTWSGDISKIKPVFKDSKGTEWGVTAVYDPYVRRYLLAVRHNGESGDWGLFDAAEPWGPWTTVAYGADFPGWTYTPDPDGASRNRPAYMHQFPQSWMSNDGITIWHMSDRGDQFNLMKATLHLVGP
ncbi:MAG: DUF4185 domain-containing protein [Deltaproteobacteria bacterium]|nr:DUF4185 domain-containing protein [Deltaproteobacteria bacterium]